MGRYWTVSSFKAHCSNNWNASEVVSEMYIITQALGEWSGLAKAYSTPWSLLN